MLTLAPLEARTPPGVGEAWPLHELERQGLVAWEDLPPERGFEWMGPVTVVFFMAAVIGNAIVSEQAPEYAPLVWVGLGSLYVLIVGMAAVVAWRGSATVARQAAQMLMLILVVAISIGAPLGTVWRFGGVELWGDSSLSVLGRLLQVAFISLACVVPGLLFFLFDRQRLSTLRDRFEQQIFRLDPNVETLSDVYARYGKQIDESFGQVGGREDTRLARQRRWPIVLATITLAFGWILTLLPVGSPDLSDTTEIPALLLPKQNAVAFGFLGAYFFALNLVLRRYARGDLRPKAYSTITVRVLVVVVLGWVLDLTAGQQGPVLVLAFLIGIVPETVLTFFREVYRGQLVARLADSLDERLPLHDLEGVDVYDRSRLLDEGVTNIEALAHHDLVDLLLETRIPAGRLVDWVDQAILCLHLAKPRQADQADTETNARARLRALGIRTATDLESGFVLSQTAGCLDLLRKAVAGDDRFRATPGPLEILMASMQDDEWLSYVRNWRRSAMLNQRTITLGSDGAVKGQSSTEIPAAPRPLDTWADAYQDLTAVMAESSAEAPSAPNLRQPSDSHG